MPAVDDLVPCERCVNGIVSVDRGARVVRRQCRECKGTPGLVLAGEPPTSRYCMTYILDRPGVFECRG